MSVKKILAVTSILMSFSGPGMADGPAVFGDGYPYPLRLFPLPDPSP